MKSQIRSPYHSLIQEATGAPSRILPILENLMRDEVFHSTLDWQSREELMAGAVKAHALYRRDSSLHNAEAAYQKARFAAAVADNALQDARAEKDADRISLLEDAIATALSRESEARTRLDRFLSPLARS